MTDKYYQVKTFSAPVPGNVLCALICDRCFHVREEFVDCKEDGQISVCSEASLPAARRGGALFRVTATLWVKVCLYKLQQTVEGVLIIIIDMVINHREGVKMCEDISMFWSSVFYAMHVTHTTNIQEYVTRANKISEPLNIFPNI